MERDGNMIEAATEWAMKLNLPFHLREKTIVKLYERYGTETDELFLRKMTRSKTGMNDRERAAHEIIAKMHPDWLYEVDLPTGSADFLDINERCLIEVKDIASWKQAASILVLLESLPRPRTWEPVVIYFGNVYDKRKVRMVEATIFEALAIQVRYLDTEKREYVYHGDDTTATAEEHRIEWSDIYAHAERQGLLSSLR